MDEGEFRRPLHWVFKVGNLKETMDFYHGVLEMQVLRHEEFPGGCEATCNGPYAGAWSKTMIGYGPETTNFTLELTYNYGIPSYAHGNDYRHIVVAFPRERVAHVEERAKEKGFLVSVHKEGEELVLAGPDGYKLRVVADEKPKKEPFVLVSLNVSDLEKSKHYYTHVLQMKEWHHLPGQTEGSVVVGYEEEQCKIELVSTHGEAIDHNKAIGRVATETRIGPKPIAKRVTEGGGRILHGPFALPPHMEEVVIILDPDGYEMCFVNEEGYKKCIIAGERSIDWEYRKEKGGDGHPLVHRA